MNFSIETIASKKLFYMRRTGPYGLANKALMETFKEELKRQNVYDKETIIYGIALDNPLTTPAELCRYDVATTTELLSGDVAVRELSFGTYAVFCIPHTEAAIQKFWSNYLNVIEKSALAVNFSQPIIERYQVTLIEQNRCEMLVPIVD